MPYKHCMLPTRAIPDSLVDIFEHALALGNVVAWMIACLDRWQKPGKLRKRSIGCLKGFYWEPSMSKKTVIWYLIRQPPPSVERARDSRSQSSNPRPQPSSPPDTAITMRRPTSARTATCTSSAPPSKSAPPVCVE